MNAYEALDSVTDHEIGHVHQDVSGGWLRAATFGAMDGLVTNISLVAGMGGAGAPARIIVLTGAAGLVAGAFSMAMGEYVSVQTQNEQVEQEWRTEAEEIHDNPAAEQAELAEMFEAMGMRQETAERAAADVHRDPERATLLHVTSELGVDPRETPSPGVAAVSSFVMFSIGALIPILPYLLGSTSLGLALGTGAVGLLLAGAVAASFTTRSWTLGAARAFRQLLYGGVAAAATYLVGHLIGIGIS